jgi:hypothetical protein
MLDRPIRSQSGALANRATNGGANASKLAELSRTLPDQIHSAAQAVALAERRLGEVLILRLTGEEVKRSQIATARMALARAQRDADDLKQILGVVSP